MDNYTNSPFVIGQKVVCTCNIQEWEDCNDPDPEIYPSKDVIYTIRTICWFEDGWYVRLEEIINQERQYSNCFGEIMFISENFAPVKPLYSDITSSLAKEALEGIGDKADSPVREIKQPINN